MTVKNLYHELEKYIKRDKGDLNVVIRTSNKSIGRSSSVNIRYITQGIDWDSDTIFINGEKELVLKDLNRDQVLSPLNFNKTFPYLADSTAKKIIWICANREEKVSSKDKYCRNCGQKLK